MQRAHNECFDVLTATRLRGDTVGQRHEIAHAAVPPIVKAVTRNELVLHYQPKFPAAGAPATGAEALLRWQHPELGLLAPDVFIPIAERSGLILPIGDWVLRRACADAAGGSPGKVIAPLLTPAARPRVPPRAFRPAPRRPLPHGGPAS